MKNSFRSTQIQEANYKVRSIMQYTMPKINDSINEMLSNIDKLKREVSNGKVYSGESNESSGGSKETV